MSALSASWGRSGNAPCSPCQPARRQLRSGARPGGGPGGPGGRPRAATSPVRPADGRPVPARRGQLGHRLRRLAALSARQRLAAAVPGAGRGRHRRRRPEGHRGAAGPQRLRDRRRRLPRPGRPAGAGRPGGRGRPLRRLAGRHPPGRGPRHHHRHPGEPTSDIPGSLLRVRVDRGSPLAEDVGPSAWAVYAYDLVMRASDPAQVAVAYRPRPAPTSSSPGSPPGPRSWAAPRP